MRRIQALALLALVFWSGTVSAGPISSSELIDKAKAYDAKLVTYQGEVIGDIMKRGQFSWINLNDGQNAIGCWLDNVLTKDITYTGSYKNKGDLLEVIGVFHRSCPEHGGDLDIHVQGLRKIKTGRTVSERIGGDKIQFALVLLFILGVIWILKRLKIK